METKIFKYYFDDICEDVIHYYWMNNMIKNEKEIITKIEKDIFDGIDIFIKKIEISKKNEFKKIIFSDPVKIILRSRIYEILIKYLKNKNNNYKSWSSNKYLSKLDNNLIEI